MSYKRSLLSLLVFGLAACSTSPQKPTNTSQIPQYTPLPQSEALALPDRVAFKQKDPRWAHVTLGGSGEPLESDGCLVTAAAMTLANLGIETDPGDLTTRLKQVEGFTPRGWLIWSGLERATGGQAKARYYDEVSEGLIDRCIREGFYPLASFDLPSGRTHWAVILRKSHLGYHMRDPLHPSRQPLIFPQGVEAFKSLRCVGLA